MTRVTEHELGFYDAIAERISKSLGDPACALTQSSLASRIGWNRASLGNFLNRIDKTIPAHFIPRIAQAFRLSMEELMGAGATAAAAERTSWNPRSDDAEILIEKLREWRERNLPNIQLHGHLPPLLLPRRGMVANYVESVFEGGSPEAAERWHDVIDAQAKLIEQQGEGDVEHLISYGDLLRLPSREHPFQRFSRDQIIYVLETVKKNWVRHRGFALIAIDDAAMTPEAKLELSSSTCIGVVGCDTRVEYGNDFRVRWSEGSEAARITYEWLTRLKRAAGFGACERPSPKQVERTIDGLLRRIDDERFEVRVQREPLRMTGL